MLFFFPAAQTPMLIGKDKNDIFPVSNPLKVIPASWRERYVCSTILPQDACVQADKCSSNDARRSDDHLSCFSTGASCHSGPDFSNTIDILHHILRKPIVLRLLFFLGEFIQKYKSSRSSSELCLSNCSDLGSMKTKRLCNNHPSAFA